MKRKLFFAIALGALLLVPGFKARAQEDTAPLPPPNRERSMIPPPDREGSILPGADELPPGQEPARRRTPARAQTPARGQTPARAQAPAETPAARQAQAQTPAAQQTPARTPAPPRTPAVPLPARGLFWGGMIGAGSLTPEADGGNVGGDAAFAGGIFAGYDFGLFTGHVEFLFTNDSVKDVRKEETRWNTSQEEWETYTSYSSYSGTLFQIPLIAKMDLHLWRFVLQPMAGVYLNFGLGDAKKNDSDSVGWENPLLGGIVGGTLGFHLGRGFLFWDLRYMGNFGDTVPKDAKGYSRSVVLSSLGYQYYFKQR